VRQGRDRLPGARQRLPVLPGPEEGPAICDRLGSGVVHSFLWRWCHLLPTSSPARIYVAATPTSWPYASSRCPTPGCPTGTKPGRAFFQGLIRDHLDVGRPDQVTIIFDRGVSSRTPGSFRTKVITRGDDPQLCCRPHSHVVTFAQLTCPSDDSNGLHAPGLRFGDEGVMVVMAAAVGFGHLAGRVQQRPTLRLRGHSVGPALYHPPGHLRRPVPPQASSNGSRTPTATYSPRSVGASPSCSPKSTAEPSPPGSPNSTPALPTGLARNPLSPPPGAVSTTPSTTTSTVRSRSVRLDLVVNLVPSKSN
jgi:hypothetical protein